ncbi:MAG: 3-oxoadipate enol-lactonase [Candidatus Diapherotrites archaeon]|nr:3-oxoadipate enol-lactonase [Candidatus Diapherotrites archaeon]
MRKYDIEWRSFEANDGARIAYRVLGDPEKPHVMLIHGWAVSGEYWRPQFPLSTGLYLIVPDLRGYGESEVKGPFTISRMVVDLLDLARREDVRFIVGHSMGGAIAQQLAANFPDMFDGVVLASTFARFGSPFSAKFFEKAVPLLNKIDLRSFARFATNFSYNVDKRTKLFFYRQYLKCNKEVVLENAKEILSYDGTWNLPAIDSPVLIIHGDHDPVVPPNHADYIADHIVDAHVVIVRDAGHEVNYNDPDLFNTLVYGFVQSAVDGVLKQ